MPAYRFCRTDDIALLVEALNACYAPHFRGREPMSPRDFKREIRELNVWCSSCMVATAGGDPIGVVTGAKRERETRVHRIGVHPDFQRRGHARHLLHSLARKLSVLGPPRIVAEVPDEREAGRALFEAAGYRAELGFADFSLPRPIAGPRATGGVDRVGLEDLLRSDALDLGAARSWQRALPTLENQKDELRGLAIASDTRVEACVLFRDLPDRGRRELVAFGGAPRRGPDGLPVLLEVVIRIACQAGSLAVTVPRVSDEEIAWSGLESLGFRRERTVTRYAARAADAH